MRELSEMTFLILNSEGGVPDLCLMKRQHNCK